MSPGLLGYTTAAINFLSAHLASVPQFPAPPTGPIPPCLCSHCQPLSSWSLPCLFNSPPPRSLFSDPPRWAPLSLTPHGLSPLMNYECIRRRSGSFPASCPQSLPQAWNSVVAHKVFVRKKERKREKQKGRRREEKGRGKGKGKKKNRCLKERNEAPQNCLLHAVTALICVVVIYKSDWRVPPGQEPGFFPSVPTELGSTVCPGLGF